MRDYETQKHCIDSFREAYEFLSNFYPALVRFDGITYFNSEAAYQAQKCSDPGDRTQFARLSGDEAKRLGNAVPVRSDWEKVKLPIMEKIVRAKFTQNRYLADYLLETGDQEIKEGNRWGDVFWGVDLKTGVGENHLGKILMALRETFRTGGIPDAEEIPEEMLFGSARDIYVVYGDITQSKCECIVNTANETLSAESGLNDAVFRAAGPEMGEACRQFGGCPVGEAKLTPGYRLKARWVIHAVGPHYGVENDEELLRSAYRSSLDIARENGIRSIAFPAISAGKFSYPKKEATRIAVETISAWKDEHPKYEIKVVFTCVDARMFDLFSGRLS